MADVNAFLAACTPGDVILITDSQGSSFSATVVAVNSGGFPLELQEPGVGNSTFWRPVGDELQFTIQGKGTY